jgi:hypothetical protein
MKINALLVSLLAASAVGCGSDPPPSQTTRDSAVETGADAVVEVGTDTPVPTDNPPPTDGPVTPANTCAFYCTQMMANCTGANAQYTSAEECLSYCNGARWAPGMEGATSGNTLACRIYHGGGPAMMMPGTHCPHAGPTGDGVCGSLMFRTDAPAMYRRVDRMGMPAVSTALIGSARKNAYNDVTTRMEHGTFATDFITSLTGLHMALDRHLMAANLRPCSMSMTMDMIGGLPQCLGQEYAPGATVASLVLPDDALNVNPSGAAGFPNGRRLQDPVIDVTLAVLLLNLGGSCGMGLCNATTLAGIPLNPGMNDRPFLTTFPYLATPHAP